VNVLIWISKFINCQDSTVCKICTLNFLFSSSVSLYQEGYFIALQIRRKKGHMHWKIDLQIVCSRSSG
jgi:hypothetical protein